MNQFENKIYSGLEKRVMAFNECGIGDFEDIMKDIRAASLYGDIESYEEIRLMDLMKLKEADDIDDGYIEVRDKTTGGIQVDFNEEEMHDMSYLDDYDKEEEQEEHGFLGFLK